MAEKSSVNDNLALKEELCYQKQRLQELSVELEAERECSSTAASESLSMILRIQGELAVEKMEAVQYKRMAESRMKYADESIAVFEQLLFLKEMEIASLKCQVQAYRNKMLMMGFSDSVIGDMRFHEHLHMPYPEDYCSDFVSIGTVRRNNSVPPFRFKDLKFEIGSLERDGSENSVSELLLQRKIYRNSDNEFDDQKNQDRFKEPTVGNITTYWKKVKQFVNQVKVLSQDKDRDILSIQGLQSNLLVYSDGLRAGLRSGLLCAVGSGDLMSDLGSKVKGCELDLKDAFTHSGSQFDDLTHLSDLDVSSTLSLGAKIIRNATESLSFQDKFDIPQTHENGKLCGKQEGEELVLGCDNKLFSLYRSKSSEPSDEATVDSHLVLESPSADSFPSQTELQWRNEQLEQLKDKSMIRKQEASGGGEQWFRVLKEIYGWINSLRFEKRSSKAKKCLPSIEFSLDSIMEAMLFYSL